MAEPPSEGSSSEMARRALGSLVSHEPERHPLVIGFASPVGTRMDPIVHELTAGLERFGYGVRSIALSDFLDGVQSASWSPLPTRKDKDYHESRMNAGDQLRTDTQSDSCLAALAISRVSELRSKSPTTTAFLLRSLKHPDEVDLLRHIYGDAFWLVAVVSGPADRQDDFAEELSKGGATLNESRAKAQRLIERDENDQSQKHGQHVEQVFAKADVFVPSRRGHAAKKDIERFLDGVFGQPFFTPYPTEEAMKLAYNASLRSASMGRQVGAVLMPTSGGVYVTGTNEVPKPGGGQYWTGDEPDHRDYQMGWDPNPSYVSTMLEELFQRLADSDLVSEAWRGQPGADLLQAARQRDAIGESILKGTRAEAVIEFTRCLHAEQAAIVNAARQGISTQDALMVTTTFPCHECAKFIVGAGVRRVVFIEPYPKSMVRQLYRDLIDARPPLPVAESLEKGSEVGAGRVPFSAFVGFAPRRYDDVFLAGERRSGLDSAAEFQRSVATPRGDGWSAPTVEQRENVAILAVQQLIENLYESVDGQAPGAPLSTGEGKRAPRKRTAVRDAKSLPNLEPTLHDTGTAGA